MEAGPFLPSRPSSFGPSSGLLFLIQFVGRPDGTRGRGCCPKMGLEQLRDSVSVNVTVHIFQVQVAVQGSGSTRSLTQHSRSEKSCLIHDG